MVRHQTPTQPVSPITARKTWRTVEPLHGMIYFAPEATDSYQRLGIRPEAGYFASRSAPMGAVGAGTVIATFYNFRPDLVRSAMDGLWSTVSPAAVLDARVDAADVALRRLLGDAVDSPDMKRASTLLHQAAARAAARCAGRPLFAGHAGLEWPDPPHLVVWHAQTLLREFRGDGHIAALILNRLDPVEALVMHAASGEVPVAFLKDTRGWSDAEWNDGVVRLTERGWVEPAAVAVDSGTSLVLTPAGTMARQKIEDITDELAVYPYQAIGEDACAELRTIVRPYSRAVVEAAGLGF